MAREAESMVDKTDDYQDKYIIERYLGSDSQLSYDALHRLNRKWRSIRRQVERGAAVGRIH